VRLARTLFPELKRHNLDTLIAHFNLPCEKRHRALDDAKAMYSFVQKAQEKPEFPDAVASLLKKASVPIHLTGAELALLPESPGVYLMFGDEDIPLYIGKSKNIRERVYSHFADDLNSSTEMKISQQVKRVEFRSTAGELGALFLESQLIKTMLPIYNKKLRNSRKMLLLKKITDNDGYDSVARIPFLNGESLGNLSDILGICKSEREAKEFLYTTAKDFSLCPKLLGLEKSSSGCFYNRLGYCMGACTKKENPTKYNIRMITAFTRSKITPWPFPGPVAIEERSIDGICEYILIDNWCYIGSSRVDAEGNKKDEHTPQGFDVDTYKILRSFLKNKNRNSKIILLNDASIGVFMSGELSST